MDVEMKSHRSKNRRYTDEEDMSLGWKVLYSLGMPILYIIALLLGIVATICNGIITSYWANLDPPKCWLYSSTASSAVVFKFGSKVSNCEWVTFGGAAALVMLVLCALIYFIRVRGRGELHLSLYILMVLSTISTLMMLAVTCTLTEGLRVTCAAMGVNTSNSRGESCQDQLNLRVSNYNLSVTSSTLIDGAMYTFWPCTILMFIITFFHLLSCYRRCYR